MGRLRVLNDPQERDPQHPSESTEHGCPGSWYRSRFCASVVPYERTQTDGAALSNPLLDRTTDALVIEATAYLERERMRAQARDMERINKG